MTLAQPLRDEHAELIPHIRALAKAGDALGRVTIVLSTDGRTYQ